MEYSFDFDNVKAEKAEAIRRFNRRQNLRKLVLIASLSLSWLSKRIPGAMQTAGNLFREFVLVLDRPLFGFFLVNLLVLVVYVLSSRKPNSPGIYDEYSRSIRTAAENTAEEKVEETVTEEAAEEAVVEKQIILENNAVLKKQTELATVTEVVSEPERAVSLSPVKQDAVRTVTEPEGTFGAAEITETKRAVSAVTEVKKKNYLRSQSEMFENKIARVELRRSETAIRGEMLIAGAEQPRKSMDELSNEEFRLTIESFIKKNKQTLIRENRARILD